MPNMDLAKSFSRSFSVVYTRLAKIDLIVVIKPIVAVAVAAVGTLVFGIVQGKESSGIQVVLQVLEKAASRNFDTALAASVRF